MEPLGPTSGSTVTFQLTCAGYLGNQANKINAKLVCSNFNAGISSSNTAEFAFKITNPNVAANNALTVPLEVYS